MSEQANLNGNKRSRGGKNGVVWRKDLPIGEDKKRSYDIYEPEDISVSKDNPVILYIYPDLFEKSSRKARQEFCIRLAARGYKVVSADYGDMRKAHFSAKEGDEQARVLINLLNVKGELGDGRAIVFSDGSGAILAMEYVMDIVNNPDISPLRPVAVVSFEGLYDLRLFALKENGKRRKAKVIRAFTGEEIKQGVITDGIVPKIREVNVCSHLDCGFPPFFFAHSAGDYTYAEQGDIMGKALRLKGIKYREYKAVFLSCKRGWQFGSGTAAESLEVSLGEFFDAVRSGGITCNEYIEI